MLKLSATLACVGLIVAPGAWAQDTPAAEPSTPEPENADIVITGQRLRGVVEGDIPPIVSYGSDDVAALGATSIGEVLQALSPQSRSGRGRTDGPPVVLVNGRRVAGFREIRDLPAEAIERVDVLPEEVALKYGYRADQRVINFVLKENFQSASLIGLAQDASEGRQKTDFAQVGAVRIAGARRSNLSLSMSQTDALLESERGFAPAPPRADPGVVRVGERDARAFRTATPEIDAVSINATLSRPFGKTLTATLNASFDGQDQLSLLGLGSARLTVPAGNAFVPSGGSIISFAPEAGPLQRDTGQRTTGLRFGLSHEPTNKGMRWSLTGQAQDVQSQVFTDTGFDAASAQARLDAGDASLNPLQTLPTTLLSLRPRDFSDSQTRIADVTFVASGSPIKAPAGPVTMTMRLEGATQSLEAVSIRALSSTNTDVSRERTGAQLNIDVPVSRRESALGAITINANVEREQLSDFETLTTYGGGLNWAATYNLDLSFTATFEAGAPSLEQLGAPRIETPNVMVFDVSRNETVTVTRVSGANPALRADDRDVYRLGGVLRLTKDGNLSLNASYNTETIDTPIAEFPALTPQIEAAFPDRFTRDDSGRLIRIDARPVNFARSTREDLRIGLDFGSGQRGGGPRGLGGGRGPGGGGGRGMMGGGPSTQFALYHTWRLNNTIAIRPGAPDLDLLNGAGLTTRGGLSEHELDLQAGRFKNGFGFRVEGKWHSATRLSGAIGAGDDLFFSDLATVNLRLFADLGRTPWAKETPWLAGAFVSLNMQNMFDEKPEVRDAAGTIPTGYEADRLDPAGRTIALSLRKSFGPRATRPPPG
jgi:hypothetical protein